MPLSSDAYALLGLTAIVGALAALLTFTVLRLVAAARDTRRQLRESAGEATLLSAALQDAVGEPQGPGTRNRRARRSLGEAER